jgi:hypothetical protein
VPFAAFNVARVPLAAVDPAVDAAVDAAVDVARVPLAAAVAGAVFMT